MKFSEIEDQKILDKDEGFSQGITAGSRYTTRRPRPVAVGGERI